jgi:uncharacterized protein YrzB (UPF0473 family)
MQERKMSKDGCDSVGCEGCGQVHDGEGEEVFVFPDEDGNEHEFFLADTVEAQGRHYAIFLPVDIEAEVEASESSDETVGQAAVILRLVDDDQGNQSLMDLESEQEAVEAFQAWEAQIVAEQGERTEET